MPVRSDAAFSIPTNTAAAAKRIKVPGRRFYLLGVRVDDVPANDVVDAVCGVVAERERMLVCNSNVHLINLAQSRPWLVEFFERADIAFCDGAGVQLAIWALTGQMPARHTPPQWILALGSRLAKDGRTVFWLGGRPETVRIAAQRLSDLTGVRVCGWQDGFFDLARDSAENAAVVEMINRAQPDVLLVNFGMPLQEKWLAENWNSLDVKVAITTGALVDHVAGSVRRPPAWVADMGLEWLVRLSAEPRRLWRRYLIGLPTFGFRLVAHMARDKLKRQTPVSGSAHVAS